MFQKLILVFLLLLACTGAPSSDTAQKNGPSSLSEKVSQLTEWASRKPVIHMNGDMFHRFVEAPPRNYSVVVMFTANRQPGGCSVCREATEEFSVLANTWRHSSSSTANANKVFFASVDLAEASNVFQALRLETVPALFHFPPPDKGKEPSEYDLDTRGYFAPLLAAWVADETGVRIHVTPPPDLTKPFILGLVLAMAGTLLYLNFQHLDGKVWAFSALFCVLLMTSGQMWNHVRAPPFAYRNPRNRQQLTFVHPSASAQFGAEAYIVAAFNAAASAGMVLLCQAPGSGGWLGAKGRCLLGNVLVMGSFAYLDHVFKTKR